MLRVMLLREEPPDPANFDSSFSLCTARLVQEASQLRARLPAYLVQRRALLDEHCPLIAPLRALVSGYEVPTTEELWATGLGTALCPPFDDANMFAPLYLDGAAPQSAQHPRLETADILAHSFPQTHNAAVPQHNAADPADAQCDSCCCIS